MGNVIPIVAILAPFLFVLGIVALGLHWRAREREWLHQERLKAIEKGLTIPDLYAGAKPKGRSENLRSGMVIAAVGVGLVILFGLLGSQERDAMFLVGAGAIPLLIGLAQITYALVFQKESDSEQRR